MPENRTHDLDSKTQEVCASIGIPEEKAIDLISKEKQSLQSQGIYFYMQRQYARAKTCFEAALKLARNARRKKNAAAESGTTKGSEAMISGDASVCRLQAFVSLMSFLLAINEKKLLTSRDFELRQSSSAESDATRTVLEHRFERRVLEAYDAGCAAVESVERMAMRNRVSSQEEVEEDSIRMFSFLDESGKDAIERLPARIRQPNEVIIFDRRRESPQEKLDNAKKMLRRFLMFHHAMGMEGP